MEPWIAYYIISFLKSFLYLLAQGKSAKKSSKKKGQKSQNEEKDISTQLQNTHINSVLSNIDLDSLTEKELKNKLRNTRKKLKEIELLEEKISNGEVKKPDPDQKKKISSKPEVIALIELYAQRVAETCPDT